ncbi:protein phosphatase 2C domain-containing protein [Halocella sp. SP3-1]|uniref:PP2C family protein-serine/threonine phosphatase n=1 Tax=Halocella sp. SP3-1 TaxID=2382161 RepID=UPI000F75EEEB|nr:protein phosphatase 2C domain-containing protein [Halocella sp. SP3-1]AZO95795.1 serine/threonine-protein phosphatase [Halocella sp. SP3-1]
MSFKTLTLLPAVIIVLIILGLIIARFIIKRKVKKPTLIVGSAQGLGKREEQEDSFSTIENESGFLAVLADGMGGFYLGKEASELVVKSFLGEFTRNYNIKSINDFLVNTTHISNYKLVEFAKEKNMGTTLIATFIRDNILYWVSVGDSQIYLFRNKELHEINPRHTFAIELRKACRKGEISRETARNHPKRDRLISYLGYRDFHLLDYSKTPIKLVKNDMVILCSDGIYNSLSTYELEDILHKRKIKAAEAAAAILDRVLSKNLNNQDNATVLVIKKVK